MPEWLSHVIQFAITIGCTYWVWRDSTKKNVPYANIWIVLTIILPLFAIVYYVYSITAAEKIKLSRRQEIEIEIRRRQEATQKRTEMERLAMAKAQEEQKAQNNMTLEEMEKLREERRIAKAKRLKELEEERRYQAEEAAKKLKMSADSLSKTKIE